jgi:hypothetical protein
VYQYINSAKMVRSLLSEAVKKFIRCDQVTAVYITSDANVLQKR